MDDLNTFSDQPSPDALEVPVLKVFDGDAFLTRIANVRTAVRFGFIDAPELEQRGGIEAREFLTALIGGRSVWIDILLKMNTGKSFDRHGRLVAVGYLADRYPDRTMNIEIEMLRNGWAWLVEKYGPDQIYFDALEVAQRNRRGIWAHEDNVPPWSFKRQKYSNRRRRMPDPDANRKLLLKRASKSRGGEWPDDDYDVYNGERVIGRIMRHPQAPDDRPWFWTIVQGIRPVTDSHGYSATREQAMADFKARWLAG
jgi:endonuclease YncB( thermonuclease family)